MNHDFPTCSGTCTYDVRHACIIHLGGRSNVVLDVVQRVVPTKWRIQKLPKNIRNSFGSACNSEPSIPVHITGESFCPCFRRYDAECTTSRSTKRSAQPQIQALQKGVAFLIRPLGTLLNPLGHFSCRVSLKNLGFL